MRSAKIWKPASIVVVGVGLVSSELAAQQPRFSGPQPGEKMTPFQVVRVDSPERVREIEVAVGERKASLVVFLHRITEPALFLMMTLEWYAHQQSDLEAHYVILSQDRGKTVQQVKRWAGHPLLAGTSSLSVSVDGLEGPGQYGLNRHVDMTILIARRDKVVSNFALLGPNNTDVPAVLKPLAELLGTEVPPVTQLESELRAQRAKLRDKQRRDNPVFKLAPNAELGRLMMALTFAERANEQTVGRAASKLREWAGDDVEKKTVLQKYSRTVLARGHAKNRYAREALEVLAGKESP